MAALLGDAALGRRFEGGAWTTLYLSPQDYHRIHFPLGGGITGWRYIPGRLWPVNAASVGHVPGLFTVNERLVTLLDSPLGLAAIVAVGATVVGRVRASYDAAVPLTDQPGPAGVRRGDYAPPRPVEKGAELGAFEMGIDRHPGLRAGAGEALGAAGAGGAGAGRRAHRGRGPGGRVSGKINAVKGMNDVLPGAVGRWQELEAIAREVFALYGYREVRTPVVEPEPLYARSVGEQTDIVSKEMYVFEDKGEDRLALRPEGTAGTIRAFIEHGAYVDGPQKWFYMGPCSGGSGRRRGATASSTRSAWRRSASPSRPSTPSRSPWCRTGSPGWA